MNIQQFLKPLSVKRALLGFSGWPDAGYMTQNLLGRMKEELPSKLVATCDLDGFWHTDIHRPHIVIRYGQIQKMDWPGYHFHLCSPAGTDPILLGTGPEPQCSWHRFVEDLLDFLIQCECKELFLLGSLRDQIFHDEIVITGMAQDPESINKMLAANCSPVEYEGPCAIHSIIIEAAQRRHIQAIGIWAHVPFYLESPHELVMVHLCQLFEYWFGFSLQTQPLMEAWRQRQHEIRELIEQSSELRKILSSMKKGTSRRKSLGLSSKVVSFEEFLKKKQEQEPEA